MCATGYENTLLGLSIEFQRRRSADELSRALLAFQRKPLNSVLAPAKPCDPHSFANSHAEP